MIAASESEPIRVSNHGRSTPFWLLIAVLLGISGSAGQAWADSDAQTTDVAPADGDAAIETGPEASAEVGDAAPADVAEQADTGSETGEETDGPGTDVAIDAGATDASGDGGARDAGDASSGGGGTSDGSVDQRRYDLVEDDDGCSYGGAGRARRTPAALTFTALGLVGLVLRRRRRRSGRERT